MRRLLTILAVVCLGLAAGLLQPSQVGAASTITAALYHPTGDDGAIKPLLDCGWHSNCDNLVPDVSPIGLDWIASTPSYTTVWIRIFAVGAGPRTYVAQARAYYQTTPCKRIRTDIYKVSNATHLYGYVIQNHSQASSTNYLNIYASTAGVRNSGVLGAMVPHAQDNCPTTWDHVMQWYVSGQYDTAWAKNDTFPPEAQCFHCWTFYTEWVLSPPQHEYYFQFVGPQ